MICSGWCPGLILTTQETHISVEILVCARAAPQGVVNRVGCLAWPMLIAWSAAPGGAGRELTFESSNFDVDRLFGNHFDRRLARGVQAEQAGFSVLDSDQHRDRV